MASIPPAGADPLHDLEFGLYNLRRTAGALRAVRCLTQDEKYAEDEAAELNCMRRADLAHLMDVLSSDLVAQLDALEGQFYELQGLQRSIDDQIARIRRN